MLCKQTLRKLISFKIASCLHLQSGELCEHYHLFRLLSTERYHPARRCVFPTRRCVPTYILDSSYTALWPFHCTISSLFVSARLVAQCIKKDLLWSPLLLSSSSEHLLVLIRPCCCGWTPKRVRLPCLMTPRISLKGIKVNTACFVYVYVCTVHINICIRNSEMILGIVSRTISVPIGYPLLVSLSKNICTYRTMLNNASWTVQCMHICMFSSHLPAMAA